MFPWEGPSWSTRDVRIMDLLEWFTCGKADCETVWGALDGDRPHFCFFKRKHPFPRDFLTYVGFSISSLILNTMLFWCRTPLHLYISVSSHGLYNSFFSAFYSKQINKNDSNPSFHEEQLPAIATRSGFAWMFSHASTCRLQVRTFTQKKKNKKTTATVTTRTTVNNSNLSLLLIFFRPDRSLRKSHFLCGVYWFAFKQSKTLN